MPSSLLQGLDTELFLSRYWQREPLLIRQAVPDFQDPISPEELAGLACEDAIESRLVFTKTENGATNWQLQPGPIPENDFLELPDKHWTLMVQSVNQWLPELDNLFSLVSFLPPWRRDDLMVSFATPGSGAGPHFDFYDVFILQGQGSRLWKLGQHCTPQTGLNTGSGMKTLDQFETEQEFELHAGDLLYIPPGKAHYGVSIDNSMSYSLGFRAPSVADMLIGVSDELADSLSEFQRYRDVQTGLAVNGQIPVDVVSSIRDRLVHELQEKPELVGRWFGTTMTAPRIPDQIEPLTQPVTSKDLTDLATTDLRLILNPFSRVAYGHSGDTDDYIQVYFDGEYLTARHSLLLLELLSKLSTDLSHQVLNLEAFMKNEECLSVLSALITRGTLITENPEETD